MVERFVPLLHEVMDLISKATTKQEKIDLLNKHNSLALKNILKGTFDDAIVWLVPDTKPPYTPADISSVPSNLFKQFDQFKYYVKGGPGEKLTTIKRETMFIRMIESIHPKDAELVLMMIAKKPPAKGLTKALVKEVFPGLISK